MSDEETSKTIQLKGAKIAIAGRLAGWGYDRKIAAGGGEVTNMISARLTCFVAGLQAGSKAARAAARGVPVISEAQLIALLEGGELTLKQAEAPRQTFDESVAELRSIFGAAPASASWTRCLEIVEACDPERLDDLVSYVEPFVDGWDDVAMPRWAPPRKHALMATAPNAWAKGNPDSEVRVAPVAWLYELLQGRYSAKHSIIRALNLEGLMLNGALGESLLKSPHLRGVRFVGLGSKARLPTSFYRSLAGVAWMGDLRELWVEAGDDGLEEAWRGDTTLKLSSMRVVGSYHNNLHMLRRYPCMQGINLHYIDMYHRSMP